MGDKFCTETVFPHLLLLSMTITCSFDSSSKILVRLQRCIRSITIISTITGPIPAHCYEKNSPPSCLSQVSKFVWPLSHTSSAFSFLLKASNARLPGTVCDDRQKPRCPLEERDLCQDSSCGLHSVGGTPFLILMWICSCESSKHGDEGISLRQVRQEADSEVRGLKVQGGESSSSS